MVSARSSRAGRSMNPAIVVVVLLVLVGSGLALTPPARAAAPNYPPLTGSVSGPNALGVNTASYYKLSATGGPAFGFNGTQIGNLTFHASLVATNTTGVSVTPTFGALTNGTYQVSLAVGNATQVVVLQVEFDSVYQQQNASLNVTYQIKVVHPYVLTGLIQAGNETVIAFPVQVLLDGQVVGSIAVPVLTPREEYNFTYDYIISGLSPGTTRSRSRSPRSTGRCTLPAGRFPTSTRSTFQDRRPATLCTTCLASWPWSGSYLYSSSWSARADAAGHVRRARFVMDSPGDSS